MKIKRRKRRGRGRRLTAAAWTAIKRREDDFRAVINGTLTHEEFTKRWGEKR